MVARLLLFAAATSLVAAKTGLAKRSTRAAPNAPLGLLNLLPASPQPWARTGCLQLIACRHDSAFDFRMMNIHHADLPEQSAAACSHLCLRERPGTQLVMAKLTSSDGHLVCGCGNTAALRTSPGPPYSSAECSQPCPEGGGLCGGPKAVSVYQLVRNREECVEPSLTYHGCYEGEAGTGAITLDPWERWAGGCAARCGSPPSPEEHLIKITTKYDGLTQCACWLSEEQLGASARQPAGECGWRCPDGAGWCGDQDQGLVSVYRAGGSSTEGSSTEGSSSHALRTGLLPLLVLLSALPVWMT